MAAYSLNEMARVARQTVSVESQIDPAILAKVEAARRRRVHIESEALEMLERYTAITAMRAEALEPKVLADPANGKLASVYDRLFTGLGCVVKGLGISGRIDPTKDMPRAPLPPDREQAVKIVIAQIKEAMSIAEQVEIARGLTAGLGMVNNGSVQATRQALVETEEMQTPV